MWESEEEEAVEQDTIVDYFWWILQCKRRRKSFKLRYSRKETGWLTNDEDLAELLQGECANKIGGEWHRHILFISRAAAEYPQMSVKAVLRWLKAKLVRSGELGSTEANTSGPVPEEWQTKRSLKNGTGTMWMADG